MKKRLLLLLLALPGLPACPEDVAKAFDPSMRNTNGLGMLFVPVPGTHVQFSAYQTRVKDYRAFIRETGYVHMRETANDESKMWSVDHDGSKQRGNSWANPGFAQTEDHPVVGVNWHDANAFCEWLTLRERAAGRLPAEWEYRLPTDHEWSVAVGLEEDPTQTPEEKDRAIKNRFPWGEWPEGSPPPKGSGNYAGAEVDDGHWPTRLGTIQDYNDGYPRTAPVGSFKPNPHGIFDLGSNVCEWCEDAYRPGATPRVLRGAAWSYRDRDFLLSSARNSISPGDRSDNRGFRCVAGATNREEQTVEKR
jgi:formylglycine-generating enzyme required for sulfatase activity